MRRYLAFPCVLFIGIVASASDTPISWPALPSTGFVSGRAATKQDVERGDAAFALESNGKAEGRPLDVKIPQYALLRDEKGGADIRSL